jgi:hypothetical protein
MADLTNLSIEQLRHLQAEAQAQIELRERKPGRSRLLQDWYSAFCTVFKEEQLLTLPHYHVWQRQQSAKVAKPHLAQAEEIATSILKVRGPVRRHDLPQVREFVVSMLLAYLRDVIQIQPTLGAACNNLGNCGVAIDHALPNYRRTGMTPVAYKLWCTARAQGVWNP